MNTKPSLFPQNQARELVDRFGALLRTMTTAERAMLCAVLPELCGSADQIKAAEQATYFLFLGCYVRTDTEAREYDEAKAAEAGTGARVITGSFRKPRAAKGARINPTTQGA